MLSKQHYVDLFSDILADAGDAGFNNADVIMEALNDAIDQWYDYHTRAAQEFKRMQSMLPHLPNKADATERARFRLVD